SLASHAITPGPWRPTEFSRPAGTGRRRGGGLPAHGHAASDLTTTAPSPLKSPRSASSAPWPAVPDAVNTGLGRTTVPTRVLRSTGSDARRRLTPRAIPATTAPTAASPPARPCPAPPPAPRPPS